MARSTLIVALLAGFAMAISQAPANACSCVIATLNDQVEGADAVFTGTVTGSIVEDIKVVYHVDVKRIYRGQVPDATVDVRTNTSTASCGLGLLPPGRTMVFFTSPGAQIFANLCGGTGRATKDYVAQVEAKLGPGEKPTVTTPADPPPPGFKVPPIREPQAVDDVPALSTMLIPGALLVLGGLCAVALAGWLRRRRTG